MLCLMYSCPPQRLLQSHLDLQAQVTFLFQRLCCLSCYITILVVSERKQQKHQPQWLQEQVYIRDDNTNNCKQLGLVSVSKWLSYFNA